MPLKVAGQTYCLQKLERATTTVDVLETLSKCQSLSDQGSLARHVFIPGQTGSGKSTILRALACEIACTGDGLLFIDPHGETVQHLLEELPQDRQGDIVFVDAANTAAPAAINPFSVREPLQRDTALENVTAMFHDLFDPNSLGIVGPRWETMFRMGMMTLLAAFDTKASLLDVPSLFVDRNFLDKCKFYLKDEVVQEYWDKEVAQTDDFHRSEVLGWFTSKFTAFRTNSVLKAVLGSGADTLDAREVMDKGKIVLVSLSKGELVLQSVSFLDTFILLGTGALHLSADRPAHLLS